MDLKPLLKNRKLALKELRRYLRRHEMIPIELLAVVCWVLKILRPADPQQSRSLQAHRKFGNRIPPFGIYFDNRPRPKGPLTKKQAELMGGALAVYLENQALGGLPAGALCAIPNAGIPVLAGMLRYLRTKREVVQMHKDGESFVIDPPQDPKNRYIVLVDNASSTGETALRAIRACRKAGWIVLAVVVVVSRKEGDFWRLKKANVKLLRAYDLLQLTSSLSKYQVFTREQLDTQHDFVKAVWKVLIEERLVPSGLT